MLPYAEESLVRGLENFGPQIEDVSVEFQKVSNARD